MAFAAGTVWHGRSDGSDTLNGAGFDPSNGNMLTDGAATLATGSSPVFTSASYTFVAGDVGHYVFIKSGTNWTPGWYPIVSVSAGAATLGAGVGAVTLSSFVLNTLAGCATTASPTAGTWAIDYSRSASARFSYTDLVIDAATNTKVTSAANPFGRQQVGNIISVTAGTGFTVQRVQIVSVTTGAATCDKSLGTLSSTGGTGGLGGSAATHAPVVPLLVSFNRIYIKKGASTHSWGAATGAAVNSIVFEGYDVTPGDNGRPTIQPSSGITILSVSGNIGFWHFKNFIWDGNTTASAKLILFSGQFSEPPSMVENCEIKNWRTSYIISIRGLRPINCYIHDNNVGSTNGLVIGDGSGFLSIERCEVNNNTGTFPRVISVIDSIFSNHTGTQVLDMLLTAGAVLRVLNVTFYNITGKAITFFDGSARQGNPLTITNSLFVTVTGNAIETGTGTNNGSIQTILENNAFYSVGAQTVDYGTVIKRNHVTLTGDPFVNAAARNFALNATVGAGAACRAAGIPGASPSGLTTGYPDIGASQHQDSGTGGGLVNPFASPIIPGRVG